MYIILRYDENSNNQRTQTSLRFTAKAGKEEKRIEKELRILQLNSEVFPENVHVYAYVAQNEQAGVDYEDLMVRVATRKEIFEMIQNPQPDILGLSENGQTQSNPLSRMLENMANQFMGDIPRDNARNMRRL